MGAAWCPEHHTLRGSHPQLAESRAPSSSPRAAVHSRRCPGLGSEPLLLSWPPGVCGVRTTPAAGLGVGL